MIPFVKMQGIGNDFVVLDTVASPSLVPDLGDFAKHVCDRRFGVGADGVLTLERDEKNTFRMRMFNPDGTEGEMCGNGIRCVALLAHLRGYTEGDKVIPIATGAGVLATALLDTGEIKVNMGPYRLDPAEIGLTWEGDRFVKERISSTRRGTAVSMGNPHLVIFVDDASTVELDHMGPILEHHPWFKNRTNVHFVQVLARDHLIQRTWERGAGITMACGTGACASAVAGMLNDLTDRATNVDLPGGQLQIEIADDQTVFMTGPAEIAFEGAWPS